MNDWGDLIARVRGLSGHLLRPEQLVSLRASSSVAALSAQLSLLQVIPAPQAGAVYDEHGLELLFRRRAGARLEVLASWAGPRCELLAALFDDEDRRSLRALVRGAIGGLSPEHRLSGLIATPSLPSRALEQLAGAGDLSTIAAALMTWGHPFGAPLATEARRQRPELLRIEMALSRVFAARTRLMLASDEALRCFVERTIDLENLWAARVLIEQPTELAPASLFVEGGTLINADDLVFAAKSRRQSELSARLSSRIRGTPLEAALEPGERASVDAFQEALATEIRRIARHEPLGLGPVVLFVLDLRAELRALLRILWSVSLGMPNVSAQRAGGAA